MRPSSRKDVKAFAKAERQGKKRQRREGKPAGPMKRKGKTIKKSKVEAPIPKRAMIICPQSRNLGEGKCQQGKIRGSNGRRSGRAKA